MQFNWIFFELQNYENWIFGILIKSRCCCMQQTRTINDYPWIMNYAKRSTQIEIKAWQETKGGLGVDDLNGEAKEAWMKWIRDENNNRCHPK